MPAPTAPAAIAKQPYPPLKHWAHPVLVGWLVPGGGHLMLKKNGRGLLLLASISIMFLAGLLMQGAMFKPESGDLLTTLINYGGFVGNLATAGLLNILAMVDAFEIASGRKD